MTFMAILPYLIPVIQGLWELLKPTIRNLLEKAWEWAEMEIDKQIDKLEQPASEAKAEMWNMKAREIYAKEGKEISEADLNLVREVIHKKMTKKRRKRPGKSG